MNYHLACSSTLLCSFLATGCSTHTIKQTKEVSRTADMYTVLVNNLLGITKWSVIDMDSRHLSHSHKGKNKKEMLMQKNKALDKWIKVADQLKEQNILLQKYFTSLQAMVDSPLQSDMGPTLGSLSQSISEINDIRSIRQGKSYKNRALSDRQAEKVAGLSTVLIGAHYAGIVRQVLDRDKDIISKQIKLQAQQLDMISEMYERRVRMDTSEHFMRNVWEPYVKDSTDSHFDDVTWANSRKEWYKKKEAKDIFVAAREANKEFSEAWIDILQGKRNIGAIGTMFSDVDSFVNQAYQLHNSIKNPPLNVPQPPQLTLQ